MDPVTWAYLIIMIISLIVAIAMAPKAAVPIPASFDDFEFPQFEEGTGQAVFFGDCWTEDWMVIGLGNFRTTSVYTKSGK